MTKLIPEKTVELWTAFALVDILGPEAWTWSRTSYADQDVWTPDLRKWFILELKVIFASVLMVQSRVMPTWLAGLCVVGGMLPEIDGTWLFSGDPESTVSGIGFIGELGSMIWVLIASVFLIRSAAD